MDTDVQPIVKYSHSGTFKLSFYGVSEYIVDCGNDLYANVVDVFLI